MNKKPLPKTIPALRRALGSMKTDLDAANREVSSVMQDNRRLRDELMLARTSPIEPSEWEKIYLHEFRQTVQLANNLLDMLRASADRESVARGHPKR